MEIGRGLRWEAGRANIQHAVLKQHADHAISMQTIQFSCRPSNHHADRPIIMQTIQPPCSHHANYAITMQSPCNRHAITMQSPCNHRAITMQTMQSPCNRHAITMQSPCNCHAITMQSPCRSSSIPSCCRGHSPAQSASYTKQQGYQLTQKQSRRLSGWLQNHSGRLRC